MRKVNFLTMFMVAAAFIFAACSNEDISTNQEAVEGDIFIRLSQDDLRAVTDPLANGVFTSFNNGALFFADNAGNILKPVIIGNNSSAEVKPSELVAGYLFTGVNANATRVVVVANVDFGVSPSFSTIEQLAEDYTVDLKDQVTDPATGNVSAALSIDNATMWGEGPIVVHAETAAEPWTREATVSISPIIARFELAKMTATSYTSNNQEGIDAGYKVDAIYLNNYYWETGVNGRMANPTGSVTNWQRDWTKYFPTGLSGTIPGSAPAQNYDGQYNVAYEGIIYDPANLTANNYELQPATGKVWAYNAFATSHATPHIVIKLSGITQNGTLRPNVVTGIPGTGYITINRYLNLTDGVSIYPIENGTVYCITDLKFSLSDIKDTPEPGDNFAVKVTVRVLPWKVINVGGGIDRG